MKTTLLISIDPELAKRLRALAVVSDVPISRIVCAAIRKEIFSKKNARRIKAGPVAAESQ